MSELWDSMGPQLWPAFWVTIQLTFYSAIGSLVWGTILAAMRVSPVPVMRGYFPRVRLVTVKDAGHWVHSERPQVVIEALRAFLRSPVAD